MTLFSRREVLLAGAAVALAPQAAFAQQPAERPMQIARDVPIRMDDGLELRADIFRPIDIGRYPVILTMGPYGKDLHWEDFLPDQYKLMMAHHANELIAPGKSSGKHLNWETVDPERWIPERYVVIRIDSRGCGKSPGVLDLFSPRETRDYRDAIEWAGNQPWSNGKVGLLGISYYAMNQWQVAATRPKHLAAIIPWEGAVDQYREAGRHGGILSNMFVKIWSDRQILPLQHGNAATSLRDRRTGELPNGPAKLTADQLAANRVDYLGAMREHRFDDDYYAARTPDLSRIDVPVLSAGNWGGLGLHLRGNFEGFLGAGSKDKWLEVHMGEHFEEFYLDRGIALQKRFFDRYLKDIDNGWEREQPRVQLSIRHPDRPPVVRAESEWPIARTQWTELHLDAAAKTLAMRSSAPQSVSFDSMSDGISFTTAPMSAEMEITGPVVLRLWVASSTVDADLFATLRAFGPDGGEVTFIGANEPAVPITQGWLRASHRALDSQRSTKHRPWHVHRAADPLIPGQPVALDIELWPTSIVLPVGYRLELLIAGRDFQRASGQGPLKGSGPFLHTDPTDRDAALYAGRTTLLTGGDHIAQLMLPVIPAK